jgi:hypothetical protein
MGVQVLGSTASRRRAGPRWRRRWRRRWRWRWRGDGGVMAADRARRGRAWSERGGLDEGVAMARRRPRRRVSRRGGAHNMGRVGPLTAVCARAHLPKHQRPIANIAITPDITSPPRHGQHGQHHPLPSPPPTPPVTAPSPPCPTLFHTTASCFRAFRHVPRTHTPTHSHALCPAHPPVKSLAVRPV